MRKSEIMKKEIFILGDSISIHYTPYLRKYLGTGWEIVRAEAITKPEGYPLRVEGGRFKLRVPGRGMDIVDIRFKEKQLHLKDNNNI